MRGGDRRHNRQAEAQAVVEAGPGAAPVRVARLGALLEGEQQAADRLGRYLLAGVGDGEERDSVPRWQAAAAPGTGAGRASRRYRRRRAGLARPDADRTGYPETGATIRSG